MQKQGTLSAAVQFVGIGLHSGKDVKLTLKPAAPDTGIVFVRSDLDENSKVVANAENVANTMRSTMIAQNEVRVSTIEHLMATFNVLRIDNCLVELDAEELPVGDGSAQTFVDLVKAAGRSEQEIAAKIFKVQEPYIVRENEKFVTILPYDGLRITFVSVNPHPLLGTQLADYEITEDIFLNEIAAARTVGFMHELKYFQAQGMALGGTLENAVVYDETQVLSKVRFDDELVRHKLLDVLGDLFLAGRVEGHVIALKSSHALNTQLAKLIFRGRQTIL